MAAGLKAVCGPHGWRVCMYKMDWAGLCRLKLPLLASVMINENTGHAVVLCSIDAGRGVEIADPLIGLYWETEERFKQRFANEVIVVYREQPYK
jgi:ABC-type bacteriocin/lantibiotic exporter with double-glycine peptidase domain